MISEGTKRRIKLSVDTSEDCAENVQGEAEDHVVQHLHQRRRPALTSLPGAVHTSGGAEAEQDGCVSES